MKEKWILIVRMHRQRMTATGLPCVCHCRCDGRTCVSKIDIDNPNIVLTLLPLHNAPHKILCINDNFIIQRFDPSIMNLVRQQWNELKSQCEHGIPRRMPELSCIVHIYLTEYFGQERYVCHNFFFSGLCCCRVVVHFLFWL